MAQRQDEQFNIRWFLAIGAAVVIASAVLLAFTPDDDASGSRTEAAGQLDGSVSSDDVGARGFVRARGSGSASHEPSGATSPPGSPGAPGTSGAPRTPGTDPTATPDEFEAFREDVADEMRERIGDEADTPEGQQLVEEAATLVEGGSDVEQAVTDVLTPPG